MDALSSLQIVFDPVHGPIGPHVGDHDGRVALLLGSPMLNRLRRIKQLGFASYGYLAADHTRYAHAVGTMHVMHSILLRVKVMPGFINNVEKDLRACSPDPFSFVNIGDTWDYLSQHMLVAGLLQDVGELPYNMATRRIFRADQNLISKVASLVGANDRQVRDWDEEKHIFTIGSFTQEENRDLLEGLDIAFLVFLITGWCRADLRNYPWLRALRHIVNGAVDADRLDYVFRDAYHTIGGIGTPQSVIQSLVGYDEHGPIFSDSAPVCNFLLTRASMWTSVYFAPQTRFRTVLLSLVLSAVRRDEHAQKLMFPNGRNGYLKLEDFIRLDDLYINERLDQLAEATGPNRPNFPPRVELALKILRGKGGEYHCLWVNATGSLPEAKRTESSDFELPNDLYYDLYEDFHQHSLYQIGSVRIDAARFSRIRRPMALEEVAGPFRQLFTSSWSAHPLPGSALLFCPNKPQGRRWQDVNHAINEGWLYPALTELNLLTDLRCPPETWSDSTFTGPCIFVSYTSADRRVLKSVLEALYGLKRKYFAYFGKWMGLGGSPITNSRDAAAACDAAILLVSRAYLEKYSNAAHDGLVAEFDELSTQRSSRRILIVPLAVDPREEIKDFRYERFGEKAQFFVGDEPLAAVTDDEIREAVIQALQRIDNKLPRPD